MRVEVMVEKKVALSAVHLVAQLVDTMAAKKVAWTVLLLVGKKAGKKVV